uniref:HTH psq-type domain-containing protein n=1 Tax=Macrostomum lignano TaxID=282301 RepID=A0A1I8ILQ4_9PLAT
MDDENLPSHPKKQKTAEAEDSVVPNQAQSRVGKPRPLNREYASPMHRRMLLKRAFDDVITYGISVRLAAETHGVAKSSLADFIRRQNIRLPNNRRHSSAAAAAASASLTCTADPNYAAPSPASLPSPGCSTASDNQQQIQSANSGLSAPVSSGAGVNPALVGGGTGHCRQWLQNGLPTLVPWYSSSTSWNVKDSSRCNSHRLPSADAASVTTKVENEISDHSQLIASSSELLVGSVVKEEPQVVDTMSLLSAYSDGAQV